VPETRPTITAVGDDGETTFKYYALYAADVPSEQVGWVLIVGGPSARDPQYVTPTEIAGDLLSMGIQDEWMHYLLRSTTEDILTQLGSRPDASDASSATAARIAELQGELAELPTLPSG